MKPHPLTDKCDAITREIDEAIGEPVASEHPMTDSVMPLVAKLDEAIRNGTTSEAEAWQLFEDWINTGHSQLPQG